MSYLNLGRWIPDLFKSRSFTQVRGILRPCCADPRNHGPAREIGDRTVVRTCKECGRNHYHMLAEPGRLGLKR